MDLNWVPVNSASSALRARLGGGGGVSLAEAELLRLAPIAAVFTLLESQSQSHRCEPEMVRLVFRSLGKPQPREFLPSWAP